MKLKINNNSIKINYIYNFIGQILTLIIPLITTPYLARVFQAEGNGQLAFANNIISYFTMIANLGFSIYGQREIAKYQNDIKKRSAIFFEIIILRSLFTVLSFSILVSLTCFNVFGSSYNNLILLFSIQIIAVFFDLTFYYQGIENFRTIAVRSAVSKLICLIFVFTFVKNSDDLWIYALVYSISILLSNLSMWISVRKTIIKVNFSELEFKKHLLPCLIIFLPTLATTIYASLDKLMIGLLSFNPDYENGNYDQGYKINQVSMVFIIVIDSIMMARNSKIFSENKLDMLQQNLHKASDYVSHIGIPMIFGMRFLSENFTSWFLGDGYEKVPMILNIMSFRYYISGMICVLGDQLFITIGKEKYATIANLTTCIVNLVLNFIFIPHYGAIGGAITTMLSELTCFIILLILALKTKFVSLKKIIFSCIKPVISSLIMVLPIYFINLYMPFGILSFLICVLCGAIVYFAIMFLLKDDFFIYVFSKTIKPFILKILKKNK